MMVPGARYITWGGMVRGEESRDRDIKKEKGPDDVAAVVWCRHRQDSGFQAGQTFPNARSAREEMVPSQVATPNNALARCCGTGLRCHLASSVAVCLGSEGRHRLALAIDPLVACRLFCTVICSLLRARPRLCCRLGSWGPALLSHGADRRGFSCDVILHPAARITAKFYVQTRPSAGFSKDC